MTTTTTARRALAAATLSAVALVTAALVAPASASAAPNRTTFEDDSFYAVVLPDPLVVTLLNTTRAQLCDGDPSGTGSTTLRLTEVLPDTTMAHQSGSVGAEVWALLADFTEDDVPPFEAPEEICDDIANATRIAAGDVRFRYVDNRLGDPDTYTGPRTNSFTTLIDGFLADEAGARWKLSLSYFDVVHPGGDWVRSGGGYTFTQQGR